MIEQDTTQQYERDCSICAHRVERHRSKRERPSNPRTMNYVCLVEGKAIGEHGTRTQKTTWDEHGGTFRWVYECPCKQFDEESGEWIPLDWKQKEEQ